jgi:hypothetical protein
VQRGQRREQKGGDECEEGFHGQCSNEGMSPRLCLPVIPRAVTTVTSF